GWLPTLPLLDPEQAYRKLEQIRGVAERAGRNPDSITYAYNIPVLVDKGAVTTKGQIAGSAEEVAKQLADLIRHGFTMLSFWSSGDATGQRERLAKEVLPCVRNLISV